jgi:hypothetical protein
MKTRHATIENLRVGDLVTVKEVLSSKHPCRLDSGACRFSHLHKDDTQERVFAHGMTGTVTGVQMPSVITGKPFVVIEWGVCSIVDDTDFFTREPVRHINRHRTAYWYDDLLKIEQEKNTELTD